MTKDTLQELNTTVLLRGKTDRSSGNPIRQKAYLFLFCGREISSPRDRNNAVQSSTAGIS